MRGGGREGKGKVVSKGYVIPSWGLCWPILGAMLAHVGAMLAHVGAMLAQLGRFFGPMLTHVEPQERKNGRSKKHCKTRGGAWAAGAGAPLSYGEERMPYGKDNARG